ncbi:MAG: D-amino acid aminotransferase [Gammaproteobacteria bacterium]
MPVCYLNGEFIALERARVSVLDRGFIFGDGVYEVIPVFNGRTFRLDQHLARLRQSLEAIRIPQPLCDRDWAGLLNTLVERNGGGDQSMYVQVTRGVAKRDHVLPEPITPTVFAMSTCLDPNRGHAPVSAITCEDIRWRYCDIKAIDLLPNVMLRQRAADVGAYEAILLRDGRLTEGAASNVFIAAGGIVKTPPKSHALLPGITRDVLVEILPAAGISCVEIEVPRAELLAAEEIWLTSSVREILAVTLLDGHPVGRGEPGPLWARAVDLYERFKVDQG